MATNIKFGTTDKLTFVAGGTYTSGTPVLIGNVLVVPLSDATSGDVVECQVRGRVKLDKTTAEAWTQGATLYWNAGTSKLTTTASTNYVVGQAGVAAGASDTKGWIDLGMGLEADSDVNTLIANLASTANGKGASTIGIEDAGALITATTVEGALAENRGALDTLEAAANTMASAADAATQILVSGGADKTTVASDARINPASVGVQGAGIRLYDDAGNYLELYAPDAMGSDESFNMSNALLASHVIVTIALGAATGSSGADADLVGGSILSCSPIAGNDQIPVSCVLNGDGSVTVTVAAVETAEATFSVLVEYP